MTSASSFKSKEASRSICASESLLLKHVGDARKYNNAALGDRFLKTKYFHKGVQAGKSTKKGKIKQNIFKQNIAHLVK